MRRRWTAVLRRAGNSSTRCTANTPERQGLSLTDLRNTITKEFPIDDLFDSLVASLGEQGFARSGSMVPACDASVRSSRAAARGRRDAAAGLSAQPIEPPSRKELTPDASSQRALKFLIESGEVIEISAELVMSAAAVAQATAQVKSLHREAGSSDGERPAAIARQQPQGRRAVARVPRSYIRHRAAR